MEYKNFWVWDKDNMNCPSSRFIEYFYIAEQNKNSKTVYTVYANLKDKTVLIATVSSRLLAKQKINDIIAGAVK